MGIPSYFNYIIKNHIDIFEKLSTFHNIDNLYFDSNSIIYDCLKEIEIKEKSKKEIENSIFENVVSRINSYINIINPKKNVFIAFDGVAPMAKIKQQRTRRFKSVLLKKISNEKTKWDTNSITPGTQFMNNLDNYIENYYKNNSQFKDINIIISCSNKIGEGEHKIFEYIRNNNNYHKNTNTFIYGLDADLIVLCLNHIKITRNLFLFRELPDYNNHLTEIYNNNDKCILNIYKLFTDVSNEMNNYNISMNDYILLTFLLGNDFLPHFPALNIRTNGIQILLETYRNIIKKEENICVNNKINWKLFKKFIGELSKNEYNYIKNECNILKKLKNVNTIKYNDKLSIIPFKNRDIEDYIDVYNKGWENRYYNILFHISSDNQIKEVCNNYLQGIEWNLEYYNNHCKNYRWYYEYDYPPLLIDLIKYIPYFNNELLQKNYNNVSPLTQLCYVLPKESLYLVPGEIREKLLSKFKYYYEKNYILNWTFCKYLWEAHLEFHYLDIKKIEKITNNYYNNNDSHNNDSHNNDSHNNYYTNDNNLKI
jgi:5'-3' exonuclease